MRLSERFQLALGSHLGTVFIGLMVLLGLLALIYWYLVIRQKRRDLLAFLNRSYYQKATELAKGFTFVGTHKADFFGRQTVVKWTSGSFGLCSIPPPNYVDQGVKDRLRCFHHAKEHLSLPLFVPVLWSCIDPILAVIEGGLVDSRGRLLPSLRHYLLDGKLGVTSREQILLELARALARLHEQRAEFGGYLYHGFLLLRSLFLELDADYRVARLLVANTGMAFAMGPQRFAQLLVQLKEGRLPIEKYSANEMLEQLAMLAPEQRNPHRVSEVGPSSDFFSYGALAVALLGQQRFASVEKIDWDKVPERWRPFLKACLCTEPGQRPQDFHELEDWLDDPELALTYTHSAAEPAMPGLEEKHSANLLTDMLKRAHVVSPARPNSDELERYLAEGLKAIKGEKWHVARTSFQKVIKIDGCHAVAHVNMAIACYQLGNRREAEVHYDAAKKADPLVAKGFRQHLAFRL